MVWPHPKTHRRPEADGCMQLSPSEPLNAMRVTLRMCGNAGNYRKRFLQFEPRCGDGFELRAAISGPRLHTIR